MRSRVLRVLAGSTALVVVLAACGSDSPEVVGPEALAPQDEAIDLVYFSDSGGWGVAERYGELASEAVGREVRVHDHATGGLAAVKVLEYVRGPLAEEVAEAEIVVVYGNPEGSGAELPEPDLTTCVSTSSAEREPPLVPTAADWQAYRDVLDDIYAEIWSLRDGRPTVLRAVDLYNPVLSPWREAGIEPECTANWELWSSVEEEAALANGATFVSPYDVFNGAAHDEDPREKGWIGPDGEHTTDDGATAIAEALAAVGFDPSTPAG